MTIIPDPETAILMTIPFLVTYFALHFILFRPLLAYLEERDHAVEAAREETVQLDTQIGEQTGTLNQKLEGAREEATAFRSAARHKAQDQEQAIIDAARAEAEQQVEHAVAEIEQARKQAGDTMRATATQLSTEIASTVLGRELQA